jgi:4-diphosphocytidyl-2-C-methyl-D-erythritol kinase
MTLLASERAYAKINLCLFLGPVRGDGRHELVTLFDSVGLFDSLEVFAASADEVVCEGVSGPNLVLDALVALRAVGWEGPFVRAVIKKRIPVAAGMGGGSADAAAMLRLAGRLAPVSVEAVGAIAASLGADVPSQLVPGPWIGTGAGEVLAPAGDLAPYAVLVVPQPFPLSTAAVYREADRLGLLRSPDELRALAGRLAGEIGVNDLQPAAVSLAPAIEEAVSAVREAGADQALVCGSGPTVIGLFNGSNGLSRASRAALAVRPRFTGAVAVDPVRGGVAGPAPNE